MTVHFARAQRQRIVQPRLTIIDAIEDQHLFARFFRDPSTWAVWFAFLATLFALPLTAAQLQLFRQCTGRHDPPATPVNEAWLVIGRRGGKSFILALIAVFLACFKDWRRILGPGERATVMIIAADKKQARVIMRFIRALLTETPMLASLVVRIRDGHDASIDLSNGITIETHVCSFRSTRGYAIGVALLDELAFWPTEDSATPDVEILNAIRPGMAQFGDEAMLLCASSPYARRGELWTAYRQHFGQDGDSVLVWQAPTLVMNPTVPQRVIDKAMAKDAAAAQAEFMAQFRTDIAAFVDRRAVEACVSVGTFERPPLADISYSAFIDPSGGSSDSMTLAIGHRDSDGNAVVDVVREVTAPFSPESTVAEFAVLLKSYRINKVEGDRYAGEWPREQFRKHLIEYELTEKTKSAIYVDALPLINSRRVDLLDHPKLVNQLCSLERRTARGGKDSIDHPPNSHDDVANACAGLCVKLAGNATGYLCDMRWVGFGIGEESTTETPTTQSADWRSVLGQLG